MIRPIHRLGRDTPISQGLLDNVKERTEFTGWYDVEKSDAEGPYDAIVVSESDRVFLPNEGPLAGTRTQIPWFWCAVYEGKLIVADGKVPAPTLDGGTLRGRYDLSKDQETMEWNPIGSPWDDREIAENEVLSNLSYQFYQKVPREPENIFFIGAGASFGSDPSVTNANELPPLGSNLFERIWNDDRLEYWHRLPQEIVDMFRKLSFEEGMEAVGNIEEERQYALARDQELSRFFAQFHPGPLNRYRGLGYMINQGLRNRSWSGAIVTLNYDRMFEEVMVDFKIYPAVKGISYVDIFDAEPSKLRGYPADNQLLEFCYPHGACHFVLYNGLFADWKDGLIFGDEGGVGGNVGAGHIIWPPNLELAFEKNYFPLMRRYQPSKRPAVSNYFLKTQMERSAELLTTAKTITILGIQSTNRNDAHIWATLGDTRARILYVEPFENGQIAFREWAREYGKKEGEDFFICPHFFENAVNKMLVFSGLPPGPPKQSAKEPATLSKRKKRNRGRKVVKS